MIKALQRRFALSRQGAVDLVKGCIACVVQDISFMIPVGLLYTFVMDMMSGSISKERNAFYAAGVLVCLCLIFLATYFQYNATYLATYVESGVRRISLAEQLRKIPLSFFGKKDLADLTNSIMGDCATLETAFSHWIPEFFGSVLSTVLIAIGLFFSDWRMALAALWVLPVSLALVGCSKKVQNYFSAKQTEAKMALADGIQECIETARDLKSCNAEQKYLRGLNGKADAVEKRAAKSELGTAMFVVTAGLLLNFGIATVALAGSVLLAGGEISLSVFFLYLLVVSRLYDPMNGSLQNLAAINSVQINIDRMKEIEEYPVQPGTADFSSNGYDVAFENVGFSYDDGETVLKDVSFVAKQGEVTALIGPSGGGKSTTAKLAARFWDADKGKITVGERT